MSDQYDVYFTQPAETIIRAVEADDPDDAIEAAYEQLGGKYLCHQCAHHFEMAGEWEPTAVFDAKGNVVWEDKR